MDRLVAKCNNNDYLTRAHYLRVGIESWYLMKCCGMKYPQECSNHYTPYTPDGNGNALYLDRQRVMCPYNYSMTHFHLQRNSSTRRHIRYFFRCCRTLPLWASLMLDIIIPESLKEFAFFYVVCSKILVCRIMMAIVFLWRGVRFRVSFEGGLVEWCVVVEVKPLRRSYIRRRATVN